MFQRGTPLAKPLIFISFSLLTKEKDFRFRPGSPFSFDRNGIDPQVRRRAGAFPRRAMPASWGLANSRSSESLPTLLSAPQTFPHTVGNHPLRGRLWHGADCRRLPPRGGSWHGEAVTDEGARLGWLSFRRHLIRLFGSPSPQGEGSGAVQTVDGVPFAALTPALCRR